MMAIKAISQKPNTELEHQAQDQPWLRAEGQMKRIVGQVQKLLTQREQLMDLRKSWSELPPEERLQRLGVQMGARKRQQYMRELSDELCEVGNLSWHHQLNLIAQHETIPMVKSLGYSPDTLADFISYGNVKPANRSAPVTAVDDYWRLQELARRSQEVTRREGVQQQREERMEQPLQEVLSDLAQAQSPNPLQQRMQQAGERVQHLATEMERHLEQQGHGRRTPPSGSERGHPSTVQDGHQQRQDTSAETNNQSRDQETRARYARLPPTGAPRRPKPPAAGDSTSAASRTGNRVFSQVKKHWRRLA